MNPDKVVCKNNSEIITATFQLLGFTVNEKKSVLIPRQKIIFFGFIIDSVEFKVYLTEEKLQKFLLRVTYLLNTRVVKVRELASVIRLIVSCFHAVLEAPLHYRSLERDKICGLGSSMNYENMVDLFKASCLDLTWWTKNIREKKGKSVRPNQVEHYCRCDASDFPVRLPRHRDLLTLPHDWTEHPLAKRITTVAAVISGNFLKVKAFYDRLPMLSSVHGDLELENSMNWHGGNGIFGVYSEKLVNLLPLRL